MEEVFPEKRNAIECYFCFENTGLLLTMPRCRCRQFAHKKCLMRTKELNMNEKTEKPSAQIIKGPWKKRRVKVPNEAEKRLREEIEFAEDINEQLMVDIIHTLNENGYDVQSTVFVCDMAFVSESLRALLYKQVGIKHPLNDIMPEMIIAEFDDKNKVTTMFDVEKAVEVIEYFEDDDAPEVS